MIAQINDLQVYYEQMGQGQEVVLLHGWGVDSAVMQPLARVLARFARVTLIDLPGHGQTGEPQKPYDIHDFASIVYLLTRQLGIQKASYIGHSNGGRTILALAANHPEQVDKIVLCAPSGIKPRRKPKYYIKVYLYKMIKNILRLPLFSDEMRHRFARGKGSEDYKKLSPIMKQTFVRLVNTDLLPILNKIQSPTLLIWGEQDTETPLYMGKLIEKEVPDCALVVYPGLGHYAFLERLGQTERIMKSFLGDVHA